MLVKYELTIANKSLIDIESIIHYTRPLTCEKELIKNFKKRYGKQLISVNILSVNDKVNFNYANTSKFNGMNGIFGTYRFNTIND